jgi:hypothetical protein
MKHVNKAGMSTEAIEQMWTGIAGAPKIEQPKITGSTQTSIQVSQTTHSHLTFSDIPAEDWRVIADV